jgi:hypothetical protein
MRTAGSAMLALIIACSPVHSVQGETGGSSLARELLKGCLSGPSKDGMARLAAAVGATAYSDARTRRELGHHETSTVVDDDTRPDEAQRTEITVTAFSGWELPGPSAGSLEYSEGDYRMTRVEVATGQPLMAWRAARTRECRVSAPVANARKIFELYESMQHAEYGILIGADRRWISVFTFDPDRYDIELHFQLDAPLAGLPAAKTGDGNSRLVLSDGGPRFNGDPGPGVPTVKLTRAALLSGLDHPADMTFNNEASEPVVQRLSQVQAPRTWN